MADLTRKTLLRNYFLKEKKGSGQIADVYRAWDKQKSVQVAIKVMRRDRSYDQEFMQFFSDEADHMAKLEHPHIVRFYDFCKDGAVVFIVMDWVEGSNLKDVINSRGKPFELLEISSILQPVCSALNYAHSQKIIHCDIKPANILIDTTGKVLLTDFGIARHTSEQTTGGTPPYMAPEQFSGKSLSSRTDIYALGITLYELLSGGKVPYRGDTPHTHGTTLRDRIYWELLNQPYPKLSQFNRRVPTGVEAVVKKALQKSPRMRYKGALEFFKAFEQARGGTRQEAASYSVSTLLPRSKPAAEPKPRREPSGTYQRVSTMREPVSVPRRLPANFRGAYLIGRAGEWAGRLVPVSVHVLTIGRSSRNLLRLSERSVSRTHATILVSRNGIFIRDEGSKLGTYVNGRRVLRLQKLRSGDIIQIGYGQKFEFRIKK